MQLSLDDAKEVVSFKDVILKVVIIAIFHVLSALFLVHVSSRLNLHTECSSASVCSIAWLEL